MKLFSIIRTFDKKQWSGYLTYIELYHNPESVLCKIASWLDSKSIWKTKRELDYTAEGLLSDLPFKMKPQSFSNAFTTLGNIAEEYIGWMVWKDSPSLKRSCQLKGLAQKSLSDEYIKTQKEILKESEDKVISIWDDYYKMQAYFNDYYYQVSPSDDNYTQEFKNLLKLFRKSTSTMAQFLMVEIRNREKLLSETWKEHENFFGLIYKYDTELVHITDQLLLMNYKGDLNAYHDLKEIIFSNKMGRYSFYIQYIISIYTINFLAGIIKKGAIHRGQELLDLYEHGLEKGIISLNDTMPMTNFLNIIGVSSKLEKYDWSRKFVNNWAHKVDKQNSKSIAKFGHATIDFHQKKYAKVVDSLSQMKSSNFQHRLRFRWLLLRAHFELNKNYIEVIKVQIDNFRRFIISNESRIKKQTFEGLKSSIKILNMLLDRKSQSQIQEYYNKSNFVFERKWILGNIKNPVR